MEIGIGFLLLMAPATIVFRTWMVVVCSWIRRGTTWARRRISCVWSIDLIAIGSFYHLSRLHAAGGNPQNIIVGSDCLYCSSPDGFPASSYLDLLSHGTLPVWLPMKFHVL
jgi:hypothetical protein